MRTPSSSDAVTSGPRRQQVEQAMAQREEARVGRHAERHDDRRLKLTCGPRGPFVQRRLGRLRWRCGSPEAYLRDNGLSRDTIAELRACILT